jgi:DNA-binding XRE family transcriptional regulator
VTRARSSATAVKTIARTPETPLPITPIPSGFIDAAGRIEIAQVADGFGMSKSQLAETVGLAREALYKTTRARAAKTQNRVREMLEIVGRISIWAGGKEQALAWYRAAPIPAFGGRTAESLVKSGQAGALRDYLDHIAIGGFA